MLLKANNIGYYYRRDQWMLRNVNIQMTTAEVVGLASPSGYGKTTLGRILAGYEAPREGQVLLDGMPLSQTGYNPVQLVFQHPERAVNPRWRMGKTLFEGGEPDMSVVDALGIKKEWLNRWPNELSGGELQRFCVARALNHRTRFLIADEMTTMLDSITQSQIWQTVLDFAENNHIGILVISHEEKLMARLCHRILDLTDINEL